MGMIRLLSVSDGYAVYAYGTPAGMLHRTIINGRRMWLADSPQGAQGVFPDKRSAARWLAGKAIA